MLIEVQYFPDGHVIQADEVEDPVLVLYLPVAQLRHTVEEEALVVVL